MSPSDVIGQIAIRSASKFNSNVYVARAALFPAWMLTVRLPASHPLDNNPGLVVLTKPYARGIFGLDADMPAVGPRDPA